jgi:site-specific recombinase XerD
MLSIIFAIGIRICELVNIRTKDLSLSKPYTLAIFGKEQKIIHVHLPNRIKQPLQKYITQKGYDRPERLNGWFFRTTAKNNLSGMVSST